MIDVNKLKAKITEKGKTHSEIANDLNIDVSTFYRKIKKGGDFSIEEVNKIVKSLALTNKDAISIFLNDKSRLGDKNN